MSRIELRVTDLHTAGEPVRIVTAGYPRLLGHTILDKRREALERHDQLRRALMLEPRGHAGMYGVIPVEPAAPDAVFGALFTHHEGYSTMCGHATIALGKWLVESGRVPAAAASVGFAIELPCGVVRLRCELTDGTVTRTAFDSVPAFLAQADVQLDVPGFGRVTCDIAYGGAFYALLPASALGLDLFGTPLDRLAAAAAELTEVARRELRIDHPSEPDLGFLYGTILTDDAPPPEPTHNLCVFADRQIDRSPTGSGVTARMARDHARGLIEVGTARRFHGLTAIPFEGSIVEAGGAGVVVRVAGSASFTGEASFVIDPADPLAYGFTLPTTLAR